jgi:hypothetical protein
LIVEPCIEDETETGVQGSSLPVEVAPAVVTPANLADGTVESIEPQASLSVTPVEIDRGEIVMIEPSPSADVTPAVLVPSDRVEAAPFPEFPDDVISLPVDGTDRPTAAPGPRDSIDPDTDAHTDADAKDITTLPKAGSSAETSSSTFGWAALALALAGVAAGAAGLHLRRTRRGL